MKIGDIVLYIDNYGEYPITALSRVVSVEENNSNKCLVDDIIIYSENPEIIADSQIKVNFDGCLIKIISVFNSEKEAIAAHPEYFI